MNSCIYRGTIRHRRMTPVRHEFRYGIFMMYVDLAELPTLFDRSWLWSARRPALAWFRRADYFGDPAIPLDEAVRDLVELKSGRRPLGAIRLLTHFRYFGYVQNPVSLYYCFDTSGSTVEAVVADITNTPWGERHAYVLTGTSPSGAVRSRHAKEFHVSPFMAMEHQYDWRFTEPGNALAVHMENIDRGRVVFDATLLLRRHALSPSTLRAALVRHPWMTVTVATGIYWQALRLWAKRAVFHPHPRIRRSNEPQVVNR